MIKDDDTVEDLTKEQQDILINKLVEHRQHKTQGMRANNVAAARDMTATSDAIIKEVGDGNVLLRMPIHVQFLSLIILHSALGRMAFFSSPVDTLTTQEPLPIMVATMRWTSSRTC